MLGLPRRFSGKESTCQCRRCGFHPWVGKIPWRRKWQLTPVFLTEKSHGQRSLAGYSPWGHKESDMAEQVHIYAHTRAHTHTHTHTHTGHLTDQIQASRRNNSRRKNDYSQPQHRFSSSSAWSWHHDSRHNHTDFCKRETSIKAWEKISTHELCQPKG